MFQLKKPKASSNNVTNVEYSGGDPPVNEYGCQLFLTRLDT